MLETPTESNVLGPATSVLLSTWGLCLTSVLQGRCLFCVPRARLGDCTGVALSPSFTLLFCSSFLNRFIVWRDRAAQRTVPSQRSCLQPSGTQSLLQLLLQPDPLHWQLSHALFKQKLWQTILWVELFFPTLPGGCRPQGNCRLLGNALWVLMLKSNSYSLGFSSGSAWLARCLLRCFPSQAACFQIQYWQYSIGFCFFFFGRQIAIYT